MKPLIEIRADDIDEADGMAVDAAVPASWIDDALSDAGLTLGLGDWEARSDLDGGRLSARLSRSGKDVVVQGRVQASITLACCRCLAPAVIPVAGELSLLLQPASRTSLGRSGGRRQDDGAEKEYEFSADEAGLDVYDGETVVLDEFVREAILLELPQFPLCSEACVGIPPGPSSATDSAASLGEPVDPRLAPLGALRDKLAGAPTSSESAVTPTTSTAQRSKNKLRATSGRGLRKTKRKRRG